MFAVMTDNGSIVGAITRDVEPDGGWKWAINGENVTGIVKASGYSPTRREAQTDLARNWRRWLKAMNLDEAHQPKFGHPLPPGTRRRLRLPE